ncbi:hypothetical protein GQ464_010595 [Rhodocaloribacter litoris]|uniref:hypothetical protein n=1 Tax=Rhodocaloribacter litoris TaxID=2558931 RepID=UPI00141EE1E7|nr:hypothetical protein [Rhodocaloribacter litoris]QXD13911.1 hypothetical protein GQ464_010595 [Rhodocaloribacter litoris]
MPRLCLTGLVPVLLAMTAIPAPAQLQTDTLFTWQGYDGAGTCRVRIYRMPPAEAHRTHVVVIQELAGNRGPTTVADARHLAEMIGRSFALDPAAAYWIFHWGAFSFEGARPASRKELFLRATFRRTGSHHLTSPTWRVVSREEVEEYTDRHFR